MKRLVLSVFIFLLVGVLMSGMGSAGYTNIVDFGGDSLAEHIGTLYSDFQDDYCMDFFGSSSTSNNDAAACDSSRSNKVTLCNSWGGIGVYITNKDVYTWTDYDSSGNSYSITCTAPVPACTTSHCDYNTCSIIGTKKSGVSCTGSCPNRESQDGVACSSGTGTCSSGICIPNTKLNVTYWANMNGKPIVNASQGETVLMIFGGAYLEGRTILYVPQEYNSSFVWWSFPTWFSKSWNDAAKIAGNAYQPWTIPSENTHQKRFGTLINLNGIDASGGQVWNHSGNLTIVGGTNAVPVLDSISPADNMRVSVNSGVWFNQNASDEDDLLKITWNFGDGNSHVIENYSSYINSSQANIRHNYTNPGIYHWTLGVEEMNPGRTNKDLIRRTIYVFKEGVNVVPVVTSPKNGESYGIKWVQFNASQTYVANCTRCNSDCSGERENGFYTDDHELNCTYLHAPGVTITDDYNLTFSWNLGEGDPVSGDLNKNYNTTVVFKHRYSTAGRHIVNLNVEYRE